MLIAFRSPYLTLSLTSLQSRSIELQSDDWGSLNHKITLSGILPYETAHYFVSALIYHFLQLFF